MASTAADTVRATSLTRFAADTGEQLASAGDLVPSSEAPPEYSSLLRTACKLFGSTPETLVDRESNPWLPLVVEVLGVLCQIVGVLYVYILSSHAQLIFIVPGAVVICSLLPAPFLYLPRPITEVHKSRLNFALFYGLYVPGLVWLVLGGAVVDDAYTPLGSQLLYFAGCGPIVLLSATRGLYLMPESALPRDQRPFWKSLIQAVLNTTIILDPVTDLALAAEVYRYTLSNTCAWGGRNRCDLFMTCFIVITLASGSQLVCTLALVFWPLVHRSDLIRMSLSSVRLVAEVIKLVQTMLLAVNVAHVGAAGQLDPAFVVASGVITVVTIAESMIGMRRWLKFARWLKLLKSLRTIMPETCAPASASMLHSSRGFVDLPTARDARKSNVAALALPGADSLTQTGELASSSLECVLAVENEEDGSKGV